MPERATAHIDTTAVVANARMLSRRLQGGSVLCPVVKADAYGHDAGIVASALAAAGFKRLAVVSAAEAVRLREAVPDSDILVMGAMTPGEMAEAIDVDAAVSVWHPGFLENAIAHAGRSGQRLRAHVKYDTGMGRLGARDPDLVLAMVERAVDTDVFAGLWTHFATADIFGDPEQEEYFAWQLERFTAMADDVRARHPDVEVTVHAANSAATLREPAAHFDMVRCGIAVYGLDPFQGDARETGLVPVMRLTARVADVKHLAPGDSVGYGRRWQAPEPDGSRIAVIPIGYADGVRRALSNRGRVLIRGASFPIVGTISMDNLTVDIGDRTDIRPGDEVVLIGEDRDSGERITAEEIARQLDTINYEITCGIGPRVPRRR